jgi:indole-3-glycerol phosphate synthase
MSAFLATMAERSRQRADAAARSRPLESLRELIESGPDPRPLRGFGSTFDVIAEIKPRSPSEGSFPDRDPVAAATRYQDGGASVLSVLTEPSSFGGSLDNLRSIAAAVSLPVMAKDFLVDSYQVFEARQAGADGILVVARILSDEEMAEMIGIASELGMFTLAEAFDGADLERISRLAPGFENVVIGVNCRDLDTLEIKPERHEELAERLPEGLVAVAESAIAGPGDVEKVAGLGYRGVLVGSALMKSEDPGRLVAGLVAAGRRAVAVTA